MTEEERRRLELEAEAEAEAEYEYLQTQGKGAAPQKTFSSELLSPSNSWEAIKSIPSGIGQGIKSAIGTIGDSLGGFSSDPTPPSNMRDVATRALAGALPFPSIASGPIASKLTAPSSLGDAAVGLVGLVPGATTAAQYAGDKLYGVPRPEAEYGQMLNQDLTLGTLGLAAGGVAGTAGAFAKNSARRAAGEAAATSAYLGNDATQAAMRYADRRGLLNTPSIKEAMARGEVTPEIDEALRVAQSEAVLTKKPSSPQYPDSPGADYLPGVSTGVPESSASTRPFAASEAMGEAGPTLIESGLYTGGERINPFTGKFEGAPSAPRDVFSLEAKATQGAVDLISARKGIVSSLDQAMQVINQQSPGMPKIQGIRFDVDVAPMLTELRDTIDKRKMLVQTEGISAEMRSAYDKVEQSFDNIKNSSLMSRWNKIGPAGSREFGELLPTEALSLIEDMNAYRRSLGEFDELVRSAGLNATFSDITGRGAELYSLSKVQQAVQSSLESKATEILGLSSGVNGYHSWMETLSQVTPQTLPSINKTYGALETGISEFKTQANTTNRGFVTPEPNRLISTQKQSQENLVNQAADIAISPRAGMVNFIADKLGARPQPMNVPLQSAQRNLQRPAAPVAMVLDGLLLREKAVPVLSRDWEKIKRFPAGLRELDARASAMGIIAAGSLLTLPEMVQREVHKQVLIADPAGAETAPGNRMLQDGKYLNPMERDVDMRDWQALPPKERALRTGGAFQNRFIPIDNAPTTAPQARSPQVPTQRYIQAFEQPVEAPASDGDKLIQQLKEASSRIDTDRSGM